MLRGVAVVLKLTESVIENLLNTWPVARLATLGSQQRPHQVPLVFVNYGGQLWSPVDGKPKLEGELTRVHNALSNPAASLLLDHYSDDWTQLWWLRIDVELEVIRLDDSTQGVVKTAQEVVELLQRKYPQYERIPVLRAPPTLLLMRPQCISSWCVEPH